ncbi:sensor histidine kinase [Mucilaginibacter sp. UR6-11]|uniref:sensor histidine kinase n=1 Tax=Mucilaginibacter sp. UR6-11 TaxID=1435644 RepID=UPI001E31576C|nr:ATP-binding protein [Mucilaginibacter sp. UR6-11]MCC8424459.1 histidine kinase [Mucilaginibacter sp. UR6-11]
MANNIGSLIILTTLVFLLAPTFIIIYISVYNRRKKKHIEEKAQMKLTFESELLKTRIEIQEQTLTHISQEIHDNITQVLSFVKLDLALTDNMPERTKQAKIKQSRELIAQAIYDLRDLSKSLSFEYIRTLGLVKTIGQEIERINKSNIITTDFMVNGTVYSLGEQRELLLFRIFQEAVNNTLKHAGAKCLKISLQYSGQLFNLTVEDDGAGFSTADLPEQVGLGLKNMHNRATLIGGTVAVVSSPGKGCFVKISLNTLINLRADGTRPDSIG